MKPIKIKKKWLITAEIVLLLFGIGFIFFRFIIGGNEDTWIQDENGIWVEHGNSSEIPAYVSWQKAAIICAKDLFNNLTGEKNSQCLGTCANYAVDIVHVPRIAEDNLPQNQCRDYGNGFVSHFIELDKNGEIVRIV